MADRRGFSLIEILTAMAVLSLLVIMLGQVVGTIGRSLKEGQQRVNNFSKARVMLDIMSRDVQSGIFRTDLSAFPNGDFALYTMVSGATGNATSLRRISLVRYSIDAASPDSVLQRGDMAIAWEDDTALISFGDSTTLPKLSNVTLRDTAPGVIQFKITFVYADGGRTFSYVADPKNPLRAVGITLVVVDDQTIKLLKTSQIQSLRTSLDGALHGADSNVKSQWENYLKNSSMNWKSYPQSLAVGLKIFERYVYLPGT